MRIISLKLEVLILEVEYALYIGVDYHLGQRTRLTGELQTCLVKVVQIEVGITCGMDEITGFESGYLRHHHGEQGIRCYVEWNAQETVGAALVKLQAQAAVSHIKLEECVARGQVHVLEVCHVPCAYYDAA